MFPRGVNTIPGPVNVRNIVRRNVQPLRNGRRNAAISQGSGCVPCVSEPNGCEAVGGQGAANRAVRQMPSASAPPGLLRARRDAAIRRATSYLLEIEPHGTCARTACRVFKEQLPAGAQ
jgi:hypothetical protein